MDEDEKTVGRPPVDIDDYFAKIRPFLEFDCSLHEACLQAGVPYTTCWDYYKNDEDFRNKVDTCKNLVIVKARNNVVIAITGEKDPQDKSGKKYLPGKEPDLKLSWEYLQNKRSNEFNKKLKFEGGMTVKDSDVLTKHKEVINKLCAKIPADKLQDVYVDDGEDTADGEERNDQEGFEG